MPNSRPWPRARRTAQWVSAATGLALATSMGLGSARLLHAAPGAVLRFVRDGADVKVIEAAILREHCEVEPVVVERDPYHEKRKRYLACPLSRVIELGFGETPAALSGENFFFRARDGYTKPAAGERLAEPGGFLAFADLGDSAPRAADGDPGEEPGWEPIGRQGVDPGPFYVVWAGEGQDDVHRYPWPYQLATIEIAPFESLHPHTVPRTAAPGAAAWQGFAIFRTECVACHAINGEGGTVGPDLNVPQSIVEYRPAEQIKAYVRDPSAFRYTTMPSHLHLSEPALDALVAYFRVMQGLKHDPRGSVKPPEPTDG